MTKIRCNLLKLSVLLSVFIGEIITCYSQNAETNANQQTAEAGKTVIYNQGGIGTMIILVFAGLIIVLLAFKYIGKYMTRDSKTAELLPVAPEISKIPKNDVSGEVNAAIAMALYLYSNELHDQENPVITMIKVSRTYSPWSSHIYGLRKLPR